MLVEGLGSLVLPCHPQNPTTEAAPHLVCRKGFQLPCQNNAWLLESELLIHALASQEPCTTAELLVLYETLLCVKLACEGGKGSVCAGSRAKSSHIHPTSF